MAVGQGAADQVVAGPLHVLAHQQRQLAPALPEHLAVGVSHLAEAVRDRTAHDARRDRAGA